MLWYQIFVTIDRSLRRQLVDGRRMARRQRVIDTSPRHGRA
jgi:hypothetical protein